MLTLIITFSIAGAVTGLCSIAEAALYSIPFSHIEVLAQQGKMSGRVLQKLRLNMQRAIAAILIMNTIATTAGAVITGAAAADVFGHRWLGFFTAFFTFFILTFAEIIPKTLGVTFNKTLAPIMALPLQGLIWLLLPVLFFYDRLTRMIQSRQPETTITAEEVQIMAHLSLRAGQIDLNQELVIRNILQLREKRAWDIMTPRTVVVSLDANLTLEQANAKGDIWPYSRMPVYNKNPEDVIGIILRRDILSQLAKGNKNVSLTAIMKPVHFVPHSARVDKLLQEFLELRQHLFVVVDEYGQIDGVVTLEDVLEEIVGREIIDEFDTTANMQELARQRRLKVIAAMKGRTPEPPAAP